MVVCITGGGKIFSNLHCPEIFTSVTKGNPSDQRKSKLNLHSTWGLRMNSEAEINTECRIIVQYKWTYFTQLYSISCSMSIYEFNHYLQISAPTLK